MTTADPYYHAPCMVNPLDDPEHTHTHEEEEPALGGNPHDNDPPTGELCGSVFWTFFNQRFHRLYPDNETFVAEMERGILNVGVAAFGPPGSGGQGPNGTGIRYFANQHGLKQLPSMHATCCEGQGTRMFGSMPEYLYTLLPLPSAPYIAKGIYVDIYADSNIRFAANGGQGTLYQSTQWPYGADVTLTLSLPAAGTFDLALRMPYWLPSGVKVNVGGAAWPTVGSPASYLHISQSWPAGNTTISFSLPMQFIAYPYTGLSQQDGYTRWGYGYGPVQLAVVGAWNSSISITTMPAGLDPSNPSKWLAPSSDGNALHWTVIGYPAITLIPYFEINTPGLAFDTFPCFP